MENILCKFSNTQYLLFYRRTKMIAVLAVLALVAAANAGKSLNFAHHSRLFSKNMQKDDIFVFLRF